MRTYSAQRPPAPLAGLVWTPGAACCPGPGFAPTGEVRPRWHQMLPPLSQWRAHWVKPRGHEEVVPL